MQSDSRFLIDRNILIKLKSETQEIDNTVNSVCDDISNMMLEMKQSESNFKYMKDDIDNLRCHANIYKEKIKKIGEDIILLAEQVQKTDGTIKSIDDEIERLRLFRFKSARDINSTEVCSQSFKTQIEQLQVKINKLTKISTESKCKFKKIKDKMVYFQNKIIEYDVFEMNSEFIQEIKDELASLLKIFDDFAPNIIEKKEIVDKLASYLHMNNQQEIQKKMDKLDEAVQIVQNNIPQHQRKLNEISSLSEQSHQFEENYKYLVILDSILQITNNLQELKQKVVSSHENTTNFNNIIKDSWSFHEISQLNEDLISDRIIKLRVQSNNHQYKLAKIKESIKHFEGMFEENLVET